jgi:hypothetical protein
MLYARLLVVTSLLGATPAARAQMDLGTELPVIYWIGPQLAADRMGALLGVDRQGNKWPDRTPTNTDQSLKTASLAYTSTATLRATTVCIYVARLKEKNYSAAQAVATNLGPGKHDYAQVYHGLVQGAGLRDNDAVDNLAAYLVLDWMLTHHMTDLRQLPTGAPAVYVPNLPRA